MESRRGSSPFANEISSLSSFSCSFANQVLTGAPVEVARKSENLQSRRIVSQIGPCHHDWILFDVIGRVGWSCFLTLVALFVKLHSPRPF